MLNGCVIAWFSKLQPTTAGSSTEAELMAAQSVVMMLLAMRKIICFMGYKQNEPSLVNEDNAACVATSKNAMLQGRTKHMQIKQSMMRDAQEVGEVNIQWIETAKQLADILTKALSREQFITLRDQLVFDVDDESLLGLVNVDDMRST